MNYRGIRINVLHADVLTCSSDLLVLKYAQASYGVDEMAVGTLGIDEATLPRPGASLLVRSPQPLAYRNLLFLGVEPIGRFGYRSVHEFARRALAEAARIVPGVREITLTLHGAGFGLDEEAAFESEIAGIAEAIESGNFPDALQSVIIVERNRGRADRMASVLGSIPDSGREDGKSAGHVLRSPGRASRGVDSAGYDSAQRQRAFVAMPFSESFEDVFYYGISPPIRAAGMLCERIDEIPFTGDVVSRMRDMIGSSTIVVADLSNANPNVYLEVGYAWGVGKPCILLCNRMTDLKFDVQGQRCLKYGSIKELEKTLSSELDVLVKARPGPRARA
jgi:hypothetical protein